MKAAFESVIKKGGYSLSDMLSKIDSYHISGKLTDADRDALYAKARENAQPDNSVDLVAKVAALELEVRALRAQVNALADNTESPDVAEYAVGKWYYNGDRVSYGGKVYRCVAPEGQVCTWSPAEYPAYWEVE